MAKGIKEIEKQIAICEETLGVMKENFLKVINDVDSMDFLIDQMNEMYEFNMKMFREWRELLNKRRNG